MGDRDGLQTTYKNYLLFNPSQIKLKDLYQQLHSEEITKESFMEGKHDLILPCFIHLSDTAFAYLLQTGVTYNLLAHYYGLNYNTNRGPFRKRVGMGLAVRETNTYAALALGKVY